MRVLIVDDHPLFAEGISRLLCAQGIQIAGTACTCRDALQKAHQSHPEVVLMDLEMPGDGEAGMQGLRLFKDSLPDVRVVILTMHNDSARLLESLRCGASGYLLKNINLEEFVDLLHCLERGELAISRAMTAMVMQDFAQQLSGASGGSSLPMAFDGASAQRLTPRQVDILQRVAQGQTYREIAGDMGIGSRTVQYHMGEILKKLNLRNRAQVIAYVQRGS
jgi:DNA-binding NarL/FixJ family response regulator